MSKVIRIGVIGTGNIAGRYLQTLQGVEGIEIAGVVDLDQERAKAFAEEHGVPFIATQDELLHDESIDIVTNLTIHFAHFDVTKAALQAGKHVYSEKPLAIDPGEAQELVQIAKENKVRLSCAPITYLGEAQQTLTNKVRSGDLGDIRVVYAEVNHGRIETWHPNPAPFYEAGPVLDVGPYPVALVTSVLGPVRKVAAWGKVVHPDRKSKDGQSFEVKSPDFVVAMLELESGTMMRLTCNFYVNNMTPCPQNVEFHGLKGSATVSSWFNFSSTVTTAEFGQPMEEIALDYDNSYDGVEWSRGLQDLASAIREDRPHRASGEHAAHVVEILCAINQSVEEGGATQEISSSFPLPEAWKPLA